MLINAEYYCGTYHDATHLHHFSHPHLNLSHHPQRHGCGQLSGGFASKEWEALKHERYRIQ